MISETLSFLAATLSEYLVLKKPGTTSPAAVIGNVAKVLDPDSNAMKGKVVVTLVNMEEDRVARQTEGYVKTPTATQYKQPPLLLNLYVLISVNRDEDYKEALASLGYIVQFFQFQKTFTPLSHPALDSRIEKLMVDLYTINFEQVNHLWSTLGGKHLPSVLYKVRQLTIDENAVIGESGLITEIVLEGKMKLASS
jgi:hypothetical protein